MSDIKKDTMSYRHDAASTCSNAAGEMSSIGCSIVPVPGRGPLPVSPPTKRSAPSSGFLTLICPALMKYKYSAGLPCSTRVEWWSKTTRLLATLQRLTAQRLLRIYPSATRVASSNLNPLPCWRTGAQASASRDDPILTPIDS